MTSYHGGKHNLGKKLAEIIVDRTVTRTKGGGFTVEGYCEPFCGMLGVYRHVPALFEERGFDDLAYAAADANKSVVLMWKRAQTGKWSPPVSCSEEKYMKLKNASPSAERGFVGHQYSFSGRFFQGYAGYDKKKSPVSASKRVKSIARELEHVYFQHKDYTQFSHLKNFVIYCDPPYADTRCHYGGAEFDTNEFWEWCRKMSKNNIVFVSEYRIPRGVKCVFRLKKRLMGPATAQSKGTEKLAMLAPY